jgi:large subunit ribosomal protein L9
MYEVNKMKVILLEKMGRLGSLGDQVVVRPGYARNYLIPQGKAVRVTAENAALFEARRASLEKQAAEKLASAQARATAINDVNLKVYGKAADEGRLYGSIGTMELSDALTKAGVTIHKSEIRLPNGPLRTIGEHEIAVQLHSEILVNMKVTVAADA